MAVLNRQELNSSPEEIRRIEKELSDRGYHLDWIAQMVGFYGQRDWNTYKLSIEEKVACINGSLGKPRLIKPWPFSREFIGNSEDTRSLNPVLLYSGGTYRFNGRVFSITGDLKEYLKVTELEDYETGEYLTEIYVDTLGINRNFSIIINEEYVCEVLPWPNISDWGSLGQKTLQESEEVLPAKWNSSQILKTSSDLIFDEAISSETPRNLRQISRIGSLAGMFDGTRTKFPLPSRLPADDPRYLKVVLGGVFLNHLSDWTLINDGTHIEFISAPSPNLLCQLIIFEKSLEFNFVNDELILNERLENSEESKVLICISGHLISPRLYRTSGDRILFPARIPRYLHSCIDVFPVKDGVFSLGFGNNEDRHWTLDLENLLGFSDFLVFVGGILQEPGISYSYINSETYGKFLSFYSPPRNCQEIVVVPIEYSDEFLPSSNIIESSLSEDLYGDYISSNWYGIHGGRNSYYSLHYMLDVMGIHGFTERDLDVSDITIVLQSEVESILYKSEVIDFGSSESFETDVAYITYLEEENSIRITPKLNWLITGTGQDRSLFIRYVNGFSEYISLNPSGREQYILTKDDSSASSSTILCRVWNSIPIRVGTGVKSSQAIRNPLVADYSSVGQEYITSSIRLPPTYSRDGSEFTRAKSVARNYMSMTSEECSVGYAYFAADMSAAEEAVFDVNTLSCQRESLPDIYTGYYTHKF